MICQVEGCTEHYGCRLRAKGISLSSAIIPNRQNVRPYKQRPMRQPSWEKGIAGEHRPSGFVPYITPKGRMGVHEAQSNRSRIEEHRRKVASGVPFS